MVEKKLISEDLGESVSMLIPHQELTGWIKLQNLL